MIIEFTVGNFRSFHEPVTLSLEAASIRSENKSVDENNVFQINKSLKLLTSAAIYGANASGKSNLVRALVFMRNLVLNSARESQAQEPIKVEPFRLSTGTITKPSHFEVIFLIEGQRYRYGFEVTQDQVVREWLYFTRTIREVQLFIRENDQITPHPRSFSEGLRLQDRTRSNALYLSVTAQFNGKVAQKIIKWFQNLKFVSGLNDVGYRGFTMQKYLDDITGQKKILNLVRSFDTGIESLQVRKINPDQVDFPKELPEAFKKLILDTPGDFFTTESQHTLFDENGIPAGHVVFDLDNDESEGTKKLFFLAGPVLDVLNAGRVLIVDEMEARMHPLITCALVEMFNSLDTNPKRAQLIFTTHDTNLLDRNLFRRDQIWFAEKDSYGASHLYSLVEFRPRNDESYERNYLRGKYGAIPYLGDLSQMINAKDQQIAEASDNVA